MIRVEPAARRERRSAHVRGGDRGSNSRPHHAAPYARERIVACAARALGGRARCAIAESWRTLRERQLRAFSMAEERALVLPMVAPEQDGRERPRNRMKASSCSHPQTAPINREHAIGRAREFEFTDSEFKRLRELVHARTGIALSDAKRELVYGRLARRLRKLKLASFAEYCRLVEDRQIPRRSQELTNAITTNLTSFFREGYHFEAARGRSAAAARIPARRRRGACGCGRRAAPPARNPIRSRSWCANAWRTWPIGTSGCSPPTSIPRCWRRRPQGVYPAGALQGRLGGAAQTLVSAGGGPARVSARRPPALKSLITFRQLNLLDPWPMKGPFDIIFCRNVVIYFDKATQRELFDRMAEHAGAGRLAVHRPLGESAQRDAALQARGPHRLPEG